MEKLYAEYGELMVQQELLNSRINRVKTAIQQGLNKLLPKAEEAVKQEVKK